MSGTFLLDQNSLEIQYLCKKDKRFAKLISMVGPIEYSVQDENSYAFLVHEIIEQMLSIKVARKIYDRLADLCDGEITPGRVSRLTDEEIRKTGTSFTKVQYIRNTTKAVLSGQLDYSILCKLPDDQVMRVLMSIQGIGRWTAQMYLMFVMNRPDILPVDDMAFRQVYKWLYKTDDCSLASIKAKCKKWKPYSSYAARYFYYALDMGLTKEAFHLYK